MNISLDFDGTMRHVHTLAERFIAFGDTVFIVTSRLESRDNSVVFEWADELGIKRENVHFTNQQLKLDKLHELNIDVHFDDDLIEVDEINTNSERCRAILVNFKHSYAND